MIVNDKEEAHQFMSFNVKVLKMLNLWLDDGNLDELKWRSWKTYSIYIFLLPSLIPLFLEVIFVFTEPEADIVIIFQVILAAVCVAGSMYMTVCFLSNRKTIKVIINSIGNFQKFTKISNTTNNNLIESDKKISFFSKAFMIYTILGMLIYVTAPTLNLSKCEKNKPFYMKNLGIPCGVIVRFRLPFRYDSWPVFHFYVIHQFLTAGMASLVIVNSTVLISGLLRHAVIQLKQLKEDVLNISENDKFIMKDKLKFCVKYHHEIINFIDDINRAFGSQLVVYVTLTSLVISVLGFEILMEQDLFESMRYSMHLSGWFILLYTICLNGQVLKSQLQLITLIGTNAL
ncbi:odorant receptor 13a-like isoform X2 [Onthophagus taurus]|uniref:odorant receptor 13a-like isoform X2 n=1 Tax=Onthophagus taurus TaxID=166361 RepID=UPI000C20F391|nr:uncharacterized protein LOC111413479 isoform X2 [Onthophagus taurus]